MAERNEEVFTRVRELLGKYPKLTSKQLFEMAVRADPAIDEQGMRSFHARYVLPVKREQARAEGRVPRRRARKAAAEPARAPAAAGEARRRPAASRGPTPAMRAQVRQLLLRLARSIAAAESRAELVDALAGIDALVDEVLDAARGDGTKQSTESAAR